MRYVVVSEAGANVYSASALGREEFPEHDAELRVTISLGRRLLDPMSELVKVEPQNVGVGQYQHDVNPKVLKETLEQIVEHCVNLVGVDLNRANATLLARVSGLNELLARRIVEHRKQHGPFRTLEQLKQVEGVTDAIFTQAAGFLRVLDGDSPLDAGSVHPESYPLVERLLADLGESTAALATPEGLEALRPKLDSIDVAAKAKELELSEPALLDLIDALRFHGRDLREESPKPIFKRGLLRLEDLIPGTELKGTVLNVVDFGAFVDVGLKDSGLVHISQLANRYIKDPHEVVSVGDVVSVWVIGVDKDRKRVSLTMVLPAPPASATSQAPTEAGPAAVATRRGPMAAAQAPGVAAAQAAVAQAAVIGAAIPAKTANGPSRKAAAPAL